jgi:hypothetical protein
MSLIKSEHSSEGKSLRQFVMFEHSVNTLSYTIRAPFPGTYRLDIYGKDITTDESVHVCMDSFATVLMSMAYRDAAIRYHLGNEYR